MFFFPHILLVILLGATSAYKLNSQENEQLQSTCGRREYRRKVLNGLEADLGYPFAVSVNINGTLSATAISPRHILLFNIVEKDSNGTVTLFDDLRIQGKVNCDGSDLVLPKESNSLFKVNFVKKQDYEIKVAKVVVVEGCKELNTYLPMVIEVGENLKFDEDRRPACLSDSSNNFEDSKEFEVFGLGPRGKRITAAKLNPTKCSKDVPVYKSCAKPVNQSQGLCAGDFGGGAIQEIAGRDTLLGIYAEGNVNCDSDPRTHPVPEFINVAYFVKAICSTTGVCVNGTEEPTTEAPELTTKTMTTQETIEYTAYPMGETVEYTSQPEEYTSQPVGMVETVGETIVAEKFEKMKLQRCAGEDQYKDHIKNIHIHLHFDDQLDSKKRGSQRRV